MGILQTLYAHWRLDAVIRAWRKAAKIMDKLEYFIISNADEALKAEFMLAQSKLDDVMEKVIKGIEDKTFADLKERI